MPLIGLSRLAHDANLRATDVLQASIADVVVLLAFLIAYHAIRRVVEGGSILDKLNKAWYSCVSLLAVGLILVAELLYRRTGELLDLDIIRFAASHMGDVHGAVNSVLGWSDLLIGVSLLLLAAVTLPVTSMPLVRGLQIALLLFPWGVLSAHAAFDQFAFDYSIVAPPSGEYQGRYARFNTDHEDWLHSQRQGWQRGILTGIVAGKAFTRFELEALEQVGDDRTVLTIPNKMSAPDKRFNVLFIILESIRHNVVGAYQGENGNTPAFPSVTPFLDARAREGWRVDRAYTTVTHTSKALVGIYCGTFPRFSPLISESEPGGIPFDCLPKMLASAGYATGHFQTAPAEFESRTGLLNNLGFATHFTQSSYSEQNWQRFAYISMDDKAMVRPSVSWMKQQRQSGKPFLASILTVLTHHPYASPVDSQPILDPTMARDRYLKALGYTDTVMAELFSEMEKAGVLDNTLVIITGDHGEGFSEHGLITHNGVSYEEGMRVPMMMWGKMLGAPKVVNGLRQHIDLVPTVLDLLGMSYQGNFPGLSLREDGGHKRIITSCFYENYCLNLYDETGEKTMYFYGKRSPARFDLKTDPSEISDLMADLPENQMRGNIITALSMKKQFERIFGLRSAMNTKQ